MLVKECNCNSKENPSPPRYFVVDLETVSIEDLKVTHKAMFKEYMHMINMYDNLATSFSSVEERLKIEQDCRIQFEEAFVELRDGYRTMGLIHS